MEQAVKCAFVKIEKNVFKVFKMNSTINYQYLAWFFELSKVVLFIKSRKTRWGIMFGWIKKTYITALLCYLSTQSIQTYASWVEQHVNFSHLHYRKAFLGEWNGYVLLVHQLDNRIVWRVGWMKRLLLFDLQSGTIHSPFTPAFYHFSLKRFLRLLPLVPRRLHAE